MSNSPPSHPHPLQDLIARVEAATGANFQLEQEIGEAVAPRGRAIHPPYTASLDAAIGLVERVLPGWMVSLLLLREHGRHFASVRNGSIINPDTIEGTGEAPTPALALLLALLRAVAAEAHEPAQLTQET